MKWFDRLFGRHEDSASTADVVAPELPAEEPEQQPEWPTPEAHADVDAARREVLGGHDKRVEEAPRRRPYDPNP